MSVYVCTKHALNRTRERFGIGDKVAANQWATRQINSADKSFWKDGKKHFIKGNVEFVTSEKRIITIQENNETSANKFVRELSEVLVKEIKRNMTMYKRKMNAVEIEIAQLNLNRLKARNPKIKALVQERMFEAMERKEEIAKDVLSLEYSAKHYGVEVD